MLSKSDLLSLEKLHDKKGRDVAGTFLIEGVKAIEEAFEQHIEVCRVVVDESRQAEADKQVLIRTAKEKHIPVFETSKSNYKRLSDTATPAGILAEVRMPKSDLSSITPGPVIALDHITDPGNMGTIIRTADWFGVKNILVSEGSVDVYNEKVVRSTMGSLHRLTIVRVEHLRDTLEEMQKKGYQVTSFTLDGSPLETYTPNKKSILVFGSESHGVSDDIKNMFPKQVTIRGGEQAESLNVAVAAGIALHHIHSHLT